MDANYVYCGNRDEGWSISEFDGVCSSAAVSGLYDNGTLSGDHGVKRPGESEWSSLKQRIEEARRCGYGRLLPRIFKNRFCFYEGRSGKKHGPFGEEKMMGWFKLGYLFTGMRICVVTDPGIRPPDEEFLSLESMFRALTQPIFAEAALVNQKPLDDLRCIRCCPRSHFAIVGSVDAVRRLPKQLPVMPHVSDSTLSQKVDVTKEAGQKLIDALSHRASKTFRQTARVWYYLGQTNRPTVHGPYDGNRMTYWFRKGWLSLDLKVWSADSVATPINVKNFRRLGDLFTSVE